MGRVLDLVVGAMRPYAIKGKGTLLDPMVPRIGRLRARVWGRMEMDLDLANAQQRQIYMGCLARQITVWIQELLPSGGTFLDVGANVGYFAQLAAHRVGANGRVLAIEPNPAVFRKLTENVNSAPHVRAEMMALSDREGSITLHVPPADENRDYNATCVNPHGAQVNGAAWVPTTVPCGTLNICLPAWDVRQVDVMKMDVEGAEPMVMAGATEVCRAGTIRHVICELNGARLRDAGTSPAELVEMFRSLGFRPARLHQHRAVPVPASEWDLHPDHEHDRLFVHESAL